MANKAIDKAVSHFENLTIRKLKVEEWSDEDDEFFIYSKPLTLSESQKLYRLSKNDDLALLAYALIYKALDADGKKLFDLEDKQKLLNSVDVQVLTKVGSWIMGTEDDAETVEKK